MWESFFREMEKRAFLMGTAAVGALTAMGVGGEAKRRKEELSLSPLRQQNQYKLQGANQYQFEGGKHTDLKETTSPHVSLYN